jgi:tRNA dimethylallyltransferase
MPDAAAPLLVITGPTAVGKSDLALEVAERLGGEIVSADSRLVYRYLDVGTAKPPLDDRVRVAHHLIDVAYPDEPYSIARYRHEAEQAVQAIMDRGRAPIVAGGSPHYLQALVDRLEPAGQSPRLRLWLDVQDAAQPNALDRWLQALDPTAAGQIDRRNRRRVLRAIEVTLVTGRPFSEAGRRRAGPVPALWIGLRREREVLRQRVERRVAAMLGAGWLEEVRMLHFMGYAPSLASMSAHGYGELARVVRGEWSLDEAIERIVRVTHAFERRQGTWFRSEPRLRWLDAAQPDVADRVIAAWQDFLHNRSQLSSDSAHES